jgi:Family of unknown function (DUF6880)
MRSICCGCFMALAVPIFERCDDSSGTVIGVFRAACSDIGDVAVKTKTDPAILTPAADALAGKHPLAATMVLRAMIDFSLTNSRSSRYKHAARHLSDCAGLSSAIADFGGFEPHDAYEARLRREHGRKGSFWSLID